MIEAGEAKLKQVVNIKDSSIKHLIDANEDIQREMFANLSRKITLLESIQRQIGIAFSELNIAINRIPSAINKFDTLKDIDATGSATIEEEDQKKALYVVLYNIQAPLGISFKELDEVIKYLSKFQHWLAYSIKESTRALGFQAVLYRLLEICSHYNKNIPRKAKFCRHCSAPTQFNV